MITDVSISIIHVFRSLWVLLAKRKSACFEFRDRIKRTSKQITYSKNSAHIGNHNYEFWIMNYELKKDSELN